MNKKISKKLKIQKAYLKKNIYYSKLVYELKIYQGFYFYAEKIQLMEKHGITLDLLIRKLSHPKFKTRKTLSYIQRKIDEILKERKSVQHLQIKVIGN